MPLGSRSILHDRHDNHDLAISTFDRDRLERLVLYVLRRAGDGARLDATKLNRLFWYADAQVFEQTGQSITGARYVRHRDGPFADAIMIARADLERNGAVRSPASPASDASLFAHEEIAALDRWIERIAGCDDIANLEGSLDYAWRIAAPGEEVAMAATLAGRIRKPTEDEIRWGKDVAAKLDLP